MTVNYVDSFNGNFVGLNYFHPSAALASRYLERIEKERFYKINVGRNILSFRTLLFQPVSDANNDSL